MHRTRLLLSGERLNHIRIGVTLNDPTEKRPTVKDMNVCASKDSPVDPDEAFSCVGVGRYVVIINEDRNYMSLCEVEVYANKGVYITV